MRPPYRLQSGKPASVARPATTAWSAPAMLCTQDNQTTTFIHFFAVDKLKEKKEVL
jgi:hypothetical protein